MSFTPCVYPLIPVSASYIGANAADSRFKGFILSIVYVSGIAVTYSGLGLIASLTGQLFGRISAYPITYMVVGAVIILFGLSMSDILPIPLLNTVRLPKHRKQNYLSTFILGLVSGLIISPCISPVLAAILAYLVTKKNILYGMTLLFSFAYGMGLVLVLIGTFSGILIRLPKSGRWLVFIKKLAALIILLSGAYFIYIGIRRL